jgi:hypothetical protein
MVRRTLLLALLLSLAVSTVSAQTSPPVPVPGDTAAYAPEIMAAARPQVAALRTCYERSLGRSRRAWQHVRSVALVLEPDGSVSDVVVNPRTARGRHFRACLVPIARGWRLPAPPRRTRTLLTYSAAELHMAAIQMQR